MNFLESKKCYKFSLLLLVFLTLVYLLVNTRVILNLNITAHHLHCIVFNWWYCTYMVHITKICLKWNYHKSFDPKWVCIAAHNWSLVSGSQWQIQFVISSAKSCSMKGFKQLFVTKAQWKKALGIMWIFNMKRIMANASYKSIM